VIAVYVIYWKGPQLRERSPFAQQLENKGKETKSKRKQSVAPQKEKA